MLSCDGLQRKIPGEKPRAEIHQNPQIFQRDSIGRIKQSYLRMMLFLEFNQFAFKITEEEHWNPGHA